MSDQPKEDQTPYIFSWRELIAPDPGAAKQFYADLFGWSSESMDMGPAGEYTFFNAGDRPAAGMIKSPDAVAGSPAMWMPYVTVPNVDDALAKALSLGAEVCKEKTTVPMGSFAVISDPQGGVLGLWEFAEQGCE